MRQTEPSKGYRLAQPGRAEGLILAEGDDKSVPIRPRVGVLSVFEAVDYKAWFALAEFVDNSIQSWLDAVTRGALSRDQSPLKIAIEATSGPEGHIRISDTAGGIPVARFASAFEVGSPPPDASGLSVYGIGMKSAGAWFADRFRITTRALGDSVERVVEYHFPTIIANGLERLEYEEHRPGQDWHGTEVLLTELKHPIQSSTHTKVRSHLTSIYRNFIRSGDLVLTYNDELLTYADPEILVAGDARDAGSEPREWRKDIDFSLSTGERVTGFAAIRKVGRAAGSGFSLYRQGRVITGLEDDPWRPTEIFGYGNTFRSQRVFGELHLDNVKVAYSKNAFVWRASQEELIEALRRALEAEPLPLLRQAENYRAREPEPRQREAAKRAIDSTADAIGKAVNRDLPDRAAGKDSAAEVSAPDLPAPVNMVASRQLEVTYDQQRWVVTIELSEDHDADWLCISDSGEPIDQDPRRIGIRVNINNSFMRRFGGTDATEMEPIMRLAAALALAVLVTAGQGMSFAHLLLRHVNRLLKGSLAE